MLLRICMFVSALLIAAPAFAADPVLRVVIPVRDIARGETIAEADLGYGTIPASTPFSGIVTSVEQLRGMEARRVLRANEIVRTDDVKHPVVIAKGSVVTMTFEAPGVTLTATGRAMGEGGVGDTITIQNPASYRQISGIVTGPGTVRATETSLSNAPPTRTAALH
jgi:flagella basal body P-ring formation protein FlgA